MTEWLVESTVAQDVSLCSPFLFSAETLISRWKSFLANADTLLKWTKKMRDRLCEVVADKDSPGVEDHLSSCKVHHTLL